MAELTLKDESVLQIGQSVSKGFNDLVASGKSILINPAGQPLGGGGDSVGPSEDTPDTEKPASIGIFETIRDKISSMVNVLTANFAFDKKIAAQDDMDSRVTEAQSTETGKEEGGGLLSKIGDAFKDKMASIGEAAKEKSMALMGGLKGMLIKGGFIFGLLAIATLMKKYGKEIAEVLTPVVDGIKKFFSVFSENIGPLFKQAVEIIKTSFTGIIDIKVYLQVTLVHFLVV